MTRHTTPDWATARSDKWRRQLDGLEAMLAPVDGPLIQALALDPPSATRPAPTPLRIADVGCGAGATTIALLRQAPPGSVAHGFDLSPALVEVARGRRTTGDQNLAFEVADMGALRPPDGRYDRLVSRLGVMFFNDPTGAFANLRRWLVDDGRLAFAVWGPLEDNPWMAETRAAVAEAIDLPAMDASAPGPFRYAAPETLVGLLASAGFSNVTATDCRPMLPIGRQLAAPAAARFALDAFSCFAELLTSAGGDALNRASRRLTERFRPYEREGAVLMPARLHIITGEAGRKVHG